MLEPTLTVTEAVAVLQLDQEQAALLLAGPFGPDAAGTVTLRQCLGCAIIYALPMLRGEDAVKIAISASLEARTNSAPRILTVGWRDNGPVGCWMPAILGMELGRPLLAIPADKLLATMETRLAEHRAAVVRPN